jgi:cyclic beta-1,2-glucan synthetase
VADGYGLIQPRVSTTLVSAGRSWFSRIFTGNTGLDPYTTAVSDIYQDLFGEGSYYGKGIYDVDAFSAALADRFPENRLLSHDLVEGLFVRVGLASDIELLDEYPAHYAVYAGRQHRWVRGDWQLLPWLLPWVPTIHGWLANDLPLMGRWKLLDNLRRSLLAPAILALLVAAWTVLPEPTTFWLALALSALAIPIFAHLATAMRRADDIGWTSYLRGFWGDLRTNVLRVLIGITFLPDQALLMLDAIARTLTRLIVTRRNLLEWETAAEAQRRADAARGAGALWWEMRGTLVLVLAIGALVVMVRPERLPLALPFVALWMLSPVVADRISRAIRPPSRHLADADARLVRRTARKTWRFFETFVTEDDHWLPPDNYQEDPRGVLARRTSPTNIGLYLVSVLAARDFSYIGVAEVADRLERTLDTVERLERYRGHLYNWYDTVTLGPLQPLYVSTVDSGNLAGHLLALAQGCAEEVRAPLVSPELLHAFDDLVDLLRQSCASDEASREPDSLEDLAQVLTRASAAPPDDLVSWRLHIGTLAACAERLVAELPAMNRSRASDRGDGTAVVDDARYWATAIARLAHATRDDLDTLAPWATLLAAGDRDSAGGAAIRRDGTVGVPSLAELPARSLELAAKLDAADCSQTTALRAALEQSAERAATFAARLDHLAQRAVTLAEGTDFGLVYDPGLRLFSIGFNVVTGQLDSSSYDLLASECRLASLIAIALGQVPQAHWFRLGRQLAPTSGGRVLLSWSGTMFEYLMPLLVMRRYGETLLDETYDAVVARQIDYGARRGVPWGISESAYNTLDLALNYQYRAFGVPGLGLKSGLAEDLVVSPYSTVMALMVDPAAAASNLRLLVDQGMEGRFGFYESIDYTEARVPPGRRAVIVRAFMAHHQGMSLVAMDNVLHGDPMVRRLHADPRVRATELLLQERVPGPVELTELRTDEPVPQSTMQADVGPTDRIVPLDGPIPSTMLLSNGTYSVLLTASGAGTSAYRGMSVTRWREDPTLDRGGTACYIRLLTSDDVDGEPTSQRARPKVWSVTFQPTLVRPDEYHVAYSPEAARYRRRDGDVETLTEVTVSPEWHAEVRRVTLTNLGDSMLTLELTSYAEVALAPPAADLAHPAFGNLFVETEFVASSGALLCTRRPRNPSEDRTWLVHVSAVDGESVSVAEYETSRAQFLGRGHDAAAPSALEPGAVLSNTVGAVLDPALSLRRVVTLGPGGRTVVSFTTAAADSRDEALELADTFADLRAVARTFELAWTDARVELRHLNLSAEQAHRFQDLAASLIFNDPAWRAPPDVLARNTRSQPALWAYGISGDRPILLIRVDDPAATELVQELLLAHEFWRLNALSVDLVILNEDPGGYLQPLQEMLLGMVRSSPAQGHLDQPGGVFVRRADQISDEDRMLLMAVARVVLLTSRGRLARQLTRMRQMSSSSADPQWRPGLARQALSETSYAPLEPIDLLFANGLGGFTTDGREYVIDLEAGATTPAPWINVVANAEFGFLVSESGSGFTWQGNSQANRLTPWSNDPIADPSGEALYLCDTETGRVWSPTPLPSPSGQPHRVRHGQGYTRFEHRAFDVQTNLALFVPRDAPVKIRHLRLQNLSDRPRRLTATLYVEWVLGTTRERAAAHVVSQYDPVAGIVFARNAYADPSGRVAFIACNHALVGATADRTAFLGRNGTRAVPAGLIGDAISWTTGAGFDPCGAIQVAVELAAGATTDLVFLLGEAPDEVEARKLVDAHREPSAAGAALDTVVTWWDLLLGTVQVHTPDRALDLLVNRWLLYQGLSCRFWARSAFYQSGGAFGFRDQLQDVLALLFAAPELAREHILRAAARQFVEGDVQHWWHPDSGQGVRTRCSDDLLWLPYVTAAYVTATGDTAVLDEVIPFIESRQLQPEDHEVFGVPTVSATSATLYEHCLRALGRGTTEGPHGLPLMGIGDWNDGMNQVGAEGRGESVWVAWFLADTFNRFAPICEVRGDREWEERCRAGARRLGQMVDDHAWDGAWYRRAYFDDGTPLGSSVNDECMIDAIAQAWAVIAGIGDADRARTAMRSLEQHLVRADDGLILLLAPPFDSGVQNPGYIKGYVPGVRENGGQYTHGALWVVLAETLLGEGTRAAELFSLLNPINHARTSAEAERYRVEPYVVAADVYGAPQHVGRGGWTWYTGSAGWMYRVAVEGILGLQLLGDCFRIDPTISTEWPRFELTYRRGDTTYSIAVENPDGVSRGVLAVELDGSLTPSTEIPFADDGEQHRVVVRLGISSDRPVAQRADQCE